MSIIKDIKSYYEITIHINLFGNNAGITKISNKNGIKFQQNLIKHHCSKNNLPKNKNCPPT